MRKQSLIFLNLLWLAIFSAYGAEFVPPQGGINAMKDELARTMKQLKMKDMKGPYYVAYTVKDNENVDVKASFGALTSSDYNHTRNLFIDLRTGSYELDNSNFIEETSLSFDLGNEGISLPIEDDYDAIRYGIWLATDEAYKDALESLSKKKATLEKSAVKDRPADFSQVKPTVSIEQEVKLNIDRGNWEVCIKELSSIFRYFPKIQVANLTLRASAVNQYFIDSEGSQYRCNNLIASLEVYAETQSADGTPMKDIIGFYGSTIDDLPDRESLKTKIREFAKEFSDRAGLEKAEEYTGPVLFDKDATCQLFYQIIGKGVSNTKPPLYQNEMFAKFLAPDEGFLAGKLKQTILPQSFDIYDDPTMKDWNGKPLVGGFKVDEQGVKSEKIELVNSGKLENLPMSRSPIKEIKTSNGHARTKAGETPVGRVSNLIVECNKGEENVREKFIQLLKDRNLEYGVLVTRLKGDIPKAESEIFLSFFSGLQGEQKKQLLSSPVCIYKMYVDGRLEPVRGLAFEDITVKTLKDIILTGVEKEVYNFISRDDFQRELPISVIAPAIVIDDLGLVKSGEKPVKLPIVSHPYLK